MIRPAAPDELDYVRATWLSGLLRGNRASAAKRARTRATIEQLLATQRPIVDARTGSRPDERDEDVIAWCCYTPLASTAVLHYVYVRRVHGYGGERVMMRGRGIGRSLVSAAGVDLARVVPYTHATDTPLTFPAALLAGARTTQVPTREVL